MGPLIVADFSEINAGCWGALGCFAKAKCQTPNSGENSDRSCSLMDADGSVIVADFSEIIAGC